MERDKKEKQGKEGKDMDDGRKKLKICLALMLIAAIAAGVVYYFKYMPRSGEKVNEGTLIRTEDGEMEADNWTDPAAGCGNVHGLRQRAAGV